MSDLSKQKAEGVGLGNQVEGYLLWQATVTVAEQRAREFVRPMEWLTTAQRTEIEQQYVSDSLHHAQRTLNVSRPAVCPCAASTSGAIEGCACAAWDGHWPPAQASPS